MSITLPNFRSSPSSDSHDHTTHAHAHANPHSSDDPIELPGLAQLPGLIQQAHQRQANKYKGKRPHEIMSASQWRAANKHNEGKQIHLQKPPKGLVTTDGVHFFSSIRVLNFYERTKNNLVKQQSEVLNRAHTFNERDMNTFQQMWEEKAILDGNIDDLRADIIERSKRLDCACRLDLHVNHLKATRNRNRLVASLQHKERQKQQAYTAKVSKFNDEKEIWMNLKQKLLKHPNPLVDLRPPTPLMPPSGLMAFPRAETMDALKYRRTVPVPPVRSFESTDVILQDQRIIQYLVRVFEEGIDQINEIADDREEKARLEEEDRNQKKKERIALAKAAEEAAMLSSDEDEEEEEEEEDPDGLEIQQIMAEMVQQIIVAGGEEDRDLILQTELTLKMEEEEEEQEEEDSTYAFSEHASDFEDEFDEETYGTGGGAWGAGNVNVMNIDFENEHSHIQNLMATAIVRSKQALIPPTFMKFISEAYALVPNEVRTRGPRFVDLTGSTGATSILTSLWSLGWSSTVTYERNYEDLILAKLHVQCIEEILGGAKKKSNDDADDEDSSESSIDDDQPRSRPRSSSPVFPAFTQSSTTIDPKTLSVPYQNNAIRSRLANQAYFFRRKFSFAAEHPWSNMDGGAPWSKADVLFVDENKMADIVNNFDVANVLRSIVTSEAWVDHRFESSLKNLVYSFAGKDKMYEKNPYTGEPELIELDKMEELLEELENKDDDSIGQCMKTSDPATYEYYQLQHLLHQRKMTAQHLKKLKNNCLVIVIRPERRAIPRSNAHQYYTTVNAKKVVKRPEVVGSNTVTLATPTTENKKDVKDVVDEECTFWNRPTDDMRAVLLDRWLNEPFFADSHGDDDEDGEDDVDDDDSANESWGGGSGNESDSGDVLERYQHLLDDKTLNGESADGGSSYEEFALSRSSLKKEKTFTLAKAKAKLYFRDHPSASPSAEYTEMLECDESRQLLDDAPHTVGAFEYIDDNFVFKTMKKASLWENGAPVSAILYRRRPREGSFLMESYL